MNDNQTSRDSWETQLRRGTLELAILATLADGRLYGVEIIRTLKERAAMDIAEGTIYPILNRLRADGLVKAEWVEADSGHPRKYYWLTAQGTARARTMAETWGRFVRNLEALLDPMTKPEKRK